MPSLAALPDTAALREDAEALLQAHSDADVIYAHNDEMAMGAIAALEAIGKKPGTDVIVLSIDGGKEAAFRFANALRVVLISNNLGDAKSLITHPATTTHQRLTPEARAAMGISDGMLRLSVGLEDVDDLLDDLRRGLATQRSHERRDIAAE